MEDTHTQNAAELNRRLATPGERHTDALHPFEETAAAVSALASAPAPSMDQSTKNSQREALLKEATSRQAVSTTHETVRLRERIASWNPFRALTLSLGSVAIVAVAVLLAVNVNTRPTQRAGTIAAVKAILIPEAHAADAFSLVATDTDTAGANTDTTFRITSKVAVTAPDLQQALLISPPVEVNVTKTGDQTFEVTPAAELMPSKVYKITIATELDKTDGVRQARAFSWAIQTKNEFRLLATVPADRSAGVPLDTGIEFQLSDAQLASPESFFQLEPSVAGKFETHGRTVVFVPEKRLAPGTIYTATLKAGFGVKDSSSVLAADVRVRFETESAAARAGAEPLATMQLQASYFEATPQDGAFLGVWTGNYTKEMNGLVELKGYKLSVDQAERMLTAQAAIPFWATAKKQREEVFATVTGQPAFTLLSEVKSQDGWFTYLEIPKDLAQGFYALHIQTERRGEPTWAIVEVTDIGTYLLTDKDQVHAWVVDQVTRQPLGNVNVRLGGKTVQTNADGIAVLPAPVSLSTSTPGTDPVTEVLRIESGNRSALVPLEQPGWRYDSWYSGGESPAALATWSYLYADRPLYRSTDTVRVFGLAQDRASRRGVGAVTLELTKGSFWDLGLRKTKVYASRTIESDAEGMFSGELSWENLGPGWYTVNLKRDGQLVTSRGFEIRDFVKPAYTIDVTTQEQQVFAGTDVHGEAVAAFFDGTPMPNLALTLTSRTADGLEVRQSLTTDDDGRAAFTIKTTARSCDPYAKYAYCPTQDYLWYSVVPVNAEEANLETGGSYVVWHSAANLSATAQHLRNTDTARVKVMLRTVNLKAIQEGAWGEKIFENPIPNQAVQARIFAHEWTKIEDGTFYDFIEKKAVPRYRYEEKIETVGDQTVTTRADGTATVEFPMTPGKDITYRVVLVSKDGQGRQTHDVVYVSRGWYDDYAWSQGYGDPSSDASDYIEFHTIKPRDERPNYRIGEEVGLVLARGSNPLPTGDNNIYLFAIAQNGVRKVVVQRTPEFRFAFGEEHSPNVTVYAATLQKATFIERTYTASFDSDTRRLDVVLKPNKERYAPGEQVSVDVSVKDLDGRGVSNATLAFSAVDEALLRAANYQGRAESPHNALYRYLPSGVLFTRTSHKATESFGMGGAEMGGGGEGGSPARRDFKDIATFQVVKTDWNGSATITFKAPDDITSWRASAIVLTGDRSGGGADTKIPVTKSLFVTAVIPQTLLSTDAPLLKVRSFGTALVAGQPLTYRITSPTLGVNESVTSTAGSPVYVNVPALVRGTHDVTVRVTAANGMDDAILRPVTVLESRFSKDELIETDLAPGSTLPDPGNTGVIDVIFLSRTRSRYLADIQQLAHPWSSRVEAKLASRVARTLLVDLFKDEAVAAMPVEPLLSYQQNGIKPLPHASEQLELSLEAALTDRTAFDASLFANYFWVIADANDSSREDAIKATAGLAALGEPVLPRLQEFAALTDLKWRERLAVTQGLVAAGDLEAARAGLELLLASSEERDGTLRVKVSEDDTEILDATAAAAPMALAMAHPKADALYQYLKLNWANDHFNPLARVRYLAVAARASVPGDVSLDYSVGGEVKRIDLKNGEPLSEEFTSTEAKAFRATRVDGPVVAVFTRTVPGRVADAPEVAIRRTIGEWDGLRGVMRPKYEFVESDTVWVELRPEWTPRAQDGCYVVRDHVASGLAPLETVSFGYRSFYDGLRWYPVDTGSGEIAFVVCKDWSVDPIRYRARVVSRGTFKAEGASLQSMDAPSVAATSPDQSITIK